MSNRAERRAAQRLNQQTAPQAVAPATIPFADPAAMPPLLTSQAQIAANRENAKLSTGPKTAEGRLASSLNRFSHGLAGEFRLLAGENPADLAELTASFHADYQPQSDTEHRLVDAMIRHYWLMQRAIAFQEQLMPSEPDAQDLDGKRLALFLRYQATHERSYYRAMRELKTLRKEARAQQIGFESQNRRQEAHDASVRLTNARARNLEIDTDCRQVMEVPLPGNTRIGFEQLTHACSTAIAIAVQKNQAKSAASAGDSSI